LQQHSQETNKSGKPDGWKSAFLAGKSTVTQKNPHFSLIFRVFRLALLI